MVQAEKKGMRKGKAVPKKGERSQGGKCLCVCLGVCVWGVMVNRCQDKMKKKRESEAERGRVLLVSEN